MSISPKGDHSGGKLSPVQLSKNPILPIVNHFKVTEGIRSEPAAPGVHAQVNQSCFIILTKLPCLLFPSFICPFTQNRKYELFHTRCDRLPKMA